MATIYSLYSSILYIVFSQVGILHDSRCQNEALMQSFVCVRVYSGSILLCYYFPKLTQTEKQRWRNLITRELFFLLPVAHYSNLTMHHRSERKREGERQIQIKKESETGPASRLLPLFHKPPTRKQTSCFPH